MSAQNTDKLIKLSRRWVSQIGSGGVADAEATTVPLSSSTNLPTDTAVIAVIDRVDVNGNATPTLEETVVGVVSSTNLINCTRGVEGTAQAHSAGAVVEVLYTAAGWNKMVDWGLVQHGQDGVHSSALVTSLKASGATVNTGTDDATIVTPKALADSTIVFANSFSRQAIINGNFDVWQRGTSGTPTSATHLWVADKWQDFHDGNGGTLPTLTRSRQTLTSGDIPNAFYYSRLSFNGAGTSLGASSSGSYTQKIERSTRMLCGDGKKVTVSFYARSDVAGKRICPTLRQFYGSGGSPSATEYIKGTPITLTSTWTKYTVTFTTNTLAGKTFGTANDDSLQLFIYCMWGSTFGDTYVQTSVSTETYVGAGYVDIAQVQLCAGDVALPFMPKSYDEELRACLRYYWTGVVRTINGIMYYNFPTTMRVTPSTLTASAGTLANGTSNGFQITHNANADSTIVANAEL